MKCEYLKFMFGRHCARRLSWAWCINESDLYFCILTFVLLQSVCKSMHETLFWRQVSILFALITRLFSIRRWLLKTIRHYSRLFVTIRHYSHCSYYSLFATIRCSLFLIRDYSLFAIRVFQTPPCLRQLIHLPSSIYAVRYRKLLKMTIIPRSVSLESLQTLWGPLTCFNVY